MNIKILCKNIENNSKDFDADRLEELFTEFAKQYHKEQLILSFVMPTLFYVLNEKNNGLTALNKYTLINEDSSGYLLKDDNNKERWFEKSWFRITPLK